MLVASQMATSAGKGEPVFRRAHGIIVVILRSEPRHGPGPRCFPGSQQFSNDKNQNNGTRNDGRVRKGTRGTVETLTGITRLRNTIPLVTIAQSRIASFSL